MYSWARNFIQVLLCLRDGGDSTTQLRWRKSITQLSIFELHVLFGYNHQWIKLNFGIYVETYSHTKLPRAITWNISVVINSWILNHVLVYAFLNVKKWEVRGVGSIKCLIKIRISFNPKRKKMILGPKRYYFFFLINLTISNDIAYLK